MTDRTSPIPSYMRHRTPRQVAEYMRDYGADVGREYLTAGDIWDDKDARRLGLQELIVDRLNKLIRQGQPHRSKSHRHAFWMSTYYDEAVRLMKQRDTHIQRIKALAQIKINSHDLRDWCDIHDLSRCFCEGNNRIWSLQRQVAKLRKIKSVADLLKLDGVGKVTMEKIRAAQNGQVTK